MKCDGMEVWYMMRCKGKVMVLGCDSRCDGNF